MAKSLYLNRALFVTLSFGSVLPIACKLKPNVTDSVTATAKKSDPTGLTKPSPEVHYKNVANQLSVYDGCKEEWIDTSLAYREEPTYPAAKLMVEAHTNGFVYASAGEKFRLYDIDALNFDKKLKPGRAPLPVSFRGIWWMDGNPWPEIIVSFGNSKYDKAAGDMSFHYNRQDAYLFPRSPAGIGMWSMGIAIDNTLHIRIPAPIDLDNIQYGQTLFVDPEIRFLGEIKGETMKSIYIADGLWRRITGTNCYNLRRIVDENGKKLPVFDYYAQQLPAINKSFGSPMPNVLIAPMRVE